MKLADQLITVIAPIHNAADRIEGFLAELHTVLSRHYDQFEILLIDRGSDDTTRVLVNALLSKWTGVRYLRLSRRFDVPTSLTAGLDVAIGDICVTLLPETDPTEAIPEVVRICLEKQNLVLGEKSDASQSWVANRVESIYAWACARFLQLRFPRHTTYFTALSRSAIQQMSRTQDKFRFLTTLHNSLGVPYTLYPYTPKPNPVRPGLFARLWNSVNASLDLIVLNSLRPLRLVTMGSLALSFANLLYMGYITAIYFLKPNPAEGWVTASSQAAMNFFLLFATLSVLSEYLGRLLSESKDRPFYYILEELNSLERVSGEGRRNTLAEPRAVR